MSHYIAPTAKQVAAINKARANGGTTYVLPALAKQLVAKGWVSLTGERAYDIVLTPEHPTGKRVPGTTKWEVKIDPASAFTASMMPGHVYVEVPAESPDPVFEIDAPADDVSPVDAYLAEVNRVNGLLADGNDDDAVAAFPAMDAAFDGMTDDDRDATLERLESRSPVVLPAPVESPVDRSVAEVIADPSPAGFSDVNDKAYSVVMVGPNGVRATITHFPTMDEAKALADTMMARRDGPYMLQYSMEAVPTIDETEERCQASMMAASIRIERSACGVINRLWEDVECGRTTKAIAQSAIDSVNRTIPRRKFSGDHNAFRAACGNANRLLNVQGWDMILSVMDDGRTGLDYGQLFVKGARSFYLNHQTIDSLPAEEVTLPPDGVSQDDAASYQAGKVDAIQGDEFPDDGDDDGDDSELGDCDRCGEPLDKDCDGEPRCNDCDGPCPRCDDGGGSGSDDAPTWDELADSCPTLPDGPIDRKSLDTFTKADLESALESARSYAVEEYRQANWAPQNDRAAEERFVKTIDDIDEMDLRDIVNECLSFQHFNQVDLADADDAQAGVDFYLTRNRDGAGYWDGDYDDAIGERLTDAAHVFGTQEFMVCDDGSIQSHG